MLSHLLIRTKMLNNWNTKRPSCII